MISASATVAGDGTHSSASNLAMSRSALRLRRALRDPAGLVSLSLADWDLIIRQARHAGILGRMALRLEAAGLLEAVPSAPRNHLLGERLLAEKHGRDVRNEVRYIAEALSPTGVSVILLKGAAYVLADLPPARG